MDALVFLKDPTIVAPLEEFLLRGSGGKVGTLGKAIQVLAGISGEGAVEVLGEILMLKCQALPLRKSALAVLLGSSSARARQILAELARGASTDPLAAELLTALSIKPA